MAGVLDGIRIVEMAGIGPGPFAGMMLADHGADVVRVERIGGAPTPIEGSDKGDILTRSRTTIQVDLKSAAGRAFLIDLVKGADGLIEGYRPGVMERLGLGPEPLLAANPALIYGRMTGWGQGGPNAMIAGHDINYLAIAGTLHMLGRSSEPPTAPANLIGDYGGGGLLLAFGMCAGLLNAARTGVGQVVDCAMVDGAAILASALWSMHAQGLWQDQRGVNIFDGGAHFYDTYETADGKFIAVGAIEPQFYRLLRDVAGLDDPKFDAQFDTSAWPDLKQRAAAVFATRTRDEWCRLLEHGDACVTPVLSMAEAPGHPHIVARGTFVTVDGVVQPAPAPRFLSTASRDPGTAALSVNTVLGQFGIAETTLAELEAHGAIAIERTGRTGVLNNNR